MGATDPSGPAVPGERRQARERALSLLYEAEQKQSTASAVLEALPTAPEEFARTLVEGVEAHGAELDELIEAASRNWTLARMPMLDRTILRLGTFELYHCRDVPVAVVIDEAVELAKAYCGDESPAFVNGVLARLATERPT